MPDYIIPPIDIEDIHIPAPSDTPCEGEWHAFDPPAKDGAWHALTCICGEVTIQGRDSRHGGVIRMDAEG